MRLLLVNPNTSAATTAAMLRIAREAAPPGVVVDAATAPFGASLILDEAALAEAGRAVEAVCATLPPYDGVVIAAFGDPGLDEARARLACPVTGIAEAGMADAGQGGRPFAVATTTPALADAIAARAAAYGHAALFRGVFLTPGEPAVLMADPSALADALAEACRAAAASGAEAVVIGGGPLVEAARAVAAALPIPIVEPVPAAIRLAQRRALGRSVAFE